MVIGEILDSFAYYTYDTENVQVLNANGWPGGWERHNYIYVNLNLRSYFDFLSSSTDGIRHSAFSTELSRVETIFGYPSIYLSNC